MKDRIRSAFEQIRADEALIENTAAYLNQALEKRKQKSGILPKLAGTFAAILILAAGIFTHNLYFTAAAYVNIDINPSVEFTLNRFDRVIATHAFNRDGEQILSEAGLPGKSYAEAAGLILALMGSNGYLTEDVLVSVTVQAKSDEREQRLCFALREFIEERLRPVQAAADIEVFPVSAEVWSNAHGCNMSPVKYLAIQELMEVDEAASIEAYRDSSIHQIRKRVQECHNAHNMQINNGGYGLNPSGEQRHGHGHRSGH